MNSFLSSFLNPRLSKHLNGRKYNLREALGKKTLSEIREKGAGGELRTRGDRALNDPTEPKSFRTMVRV